MAPEIKYTKLFINNEWVDAQSGKTFETYNPHDGSVIARVAEGDEADVDLAVVAARRAFHRNSEWRLMDPSKRRRLLHVFSALIERDVEYLAELETYNNGMLLDTAKRLATSIGVVYGPYISSLADTFHGDTVPTDGDTFSYTLKQPVGVCGLILPWNVPILMFAAKVFSALAAGCTVVVKPAEQTPLTALALAALAAEAGLPPGVLNVVTGFAAAGAALTYHSDVNKISFTGSHQVGKLIQQASGLSNLKRITLELGGKSPLVIMNDADLNLAVQFAAHGVYWLSGQVCMAASRLFVQSDIYDEFVSRAVEHARKLKLGNPTSPDTQQGPQTDEATMLKALEYIEKGKQEGAKLMTGGNRVGATGYYIEPTVFADVTDDMCIAIDEIFGPVQSILKFDTLEEVIDRANNTFYGLAAGIFTSNVNNALQFTKHVEAGTVWVNDYLNVCPGLPFGGFKQSGIGREYGRNCIDAYLEVKTVVISLPKRV